MQCSSKGWSNHLGNKDLKKKIYKRISMFIFYAAGIHDSLNSQFKQVEWPRIFLDID